MIYGLQKNPIALWDAVGYCRAADLPLPDWATVAVQNIIRDHFELAKGNRGRTGGIKGRLKADYAHYNRWNAVKTVLNIHDLSELPDRRGRPVPGKLTADPLLREAKTFLKGSAKHGGLEQIRKSFRIVENSLAAGEARFNFHHLISTP